MQKVFDKVNECLEKYIGGTAFFDELDRLVKFDKEVLMQYYDMVACNNTAKTIASGEFGLCLHNYQIPVDILVQGGLRKGVPICDLSNFIISGEKYLFLDDSYFSGRTAQVVKEEVEKHGGIFVGCHVVYDGSLSPIHEVKSIYRYCDYYTILGKKRVDNKE